MLIISVAVDSVLIRQGTDINGGMITEEHGYAAKEAVSNECIARAKKIVNSLHITAVHQQKHCSQTAQTYKHITTHPLRADDCT